MSTDTQAERGQGLDVQEEAIESWVAVHGHQLVAVTRDEGVSGSNGLDGREGLAEAIGLVQDGAADGIVVYRTDRLARDLVVQETVLSEVWRLGARVFSTSDAENEYLDPNGAENDPSRTLIRQVLGAVAQYERAMIRLRLKAGRNRKAREGGYIGGIPPLGYELRDDGTLSPIDAELAAVDRIRQLHADGLSLRAIARTLESEGFKPKRAEHWSAEGIRRVVARQPHP